LVNLYVHLCVSYALKQHIIFKSKQFQKL